MKAWAIQEYGDNSRVQLMDVPEPGVGDRDVLIQVKAASINPVDFKIRQGSLKAVYTYSFPLILGHDCAGVIVKTGAGVKRFQVGDEVYTRPKTIGTLAELVSANENDVAKKPHNASFEEAAGLPLVGLTSWQALVERAGMKKGDKVFIPAGSGGVGTFAIQLAKLFGAYVLTTTSAKNVDLVRSLGADEAIDYKKADFSKEASGFDIVFDTLGGETQAKAFGILKPGGILVSIVGPPTPAFMRVSGRSPVLRAASLVLSSRVLIRSFQTKTRYEFFLMHPDGKTLEKIAEFVEQGFIRPAIDRSFPFDKANEALAHAEEGHAIGKVIVSSTESAP